jgi:hypothetical protein
MARLSVGAKAQRVARFLTGLQNAQVAQRLAQHGFTNEDRVEGYRLMAALTDDALSAKPAAPADPSLLSRLDAFENLWYPIISASLRHRFPAAHEHVFRNLRQVVGPELIIGVGTLIRRIDELPTAVAEGAEARALLERRGLTEAVVESARATLREIKADPDPLPAPMLGREERAAREEAMWHWYLEWSAIARTVITERRSLRALGFLQNRSSAGRDEGEQHEDFVGDEDPEDPGDDEL